MENKSTLNPIELLIPLLPLILSTLILIHKHLKKPNKTTPSPPLPPGPTGLLFVGCLLEMIKNKPTFRWIHQLMNQMNTEILHIPLGNTHIIPVTSPELAREFLRKHDTVFASRPDCMTGKLASSGYLTAALSPYGEQWKKMRRVLSSEVLSPAMHRRLHDKRQEEADHLVGYVYRQSRRENGLVNVRLAAQHYCGNAIRKLVFGKRFFGAGMEDGGPGVEEKEHVGGLFTILTYLYGFAIADFVPWLEIFDFDGHKKILGDAITSVTKYQDPEIEDRVEMWRSGMREKEDDILDVLINLKDSKNNPLLSVEEIKAQITEIMIATVDNPSNAIEWAIAEMINQPDILNRAYHELDQVVGRGRLVKESDLPKLNYIKACVKESFRLHPIAPFNVPHVSIEDAVVGGYFIPRGSHVLLSRPGLGRNPRVWEEPLEYRPERHIITDGGEVALVDNELRILSFSTGRRGCAGVLLGSTTATILLARFIQGFDWGGPVDGSGFKLVESEGDLLMAEPLVACAVPRLELRVYLELLQN